jgi:hypothetical protein
MNERTRPDDATIAAEEHEARVTARADREPTAEEAALADEQTLDPGVAEHEREMNERGARQRGEGRIA